MEDLQKIDQEKNVLRLGGLSGMLGGILFMIVMVFVSVFVPPDPTELVEWVIRFPVINTVRIVENLIYLTALILELFLFLALYRSLCKTSLASALFGSALGILGLTAMIVSATPHVAHSPLSEIFHTTGVTPADKATIAILWKGAWGIYDSMLYVGFFIVPLGLISLGIGMFGNQSFGRVFGGVTMVLGVIGIVAAILQMTYPASMVGSISYFACLFFYLILGWKVYSLSRQI